MAAWGKLAALGFAALAVAWTGLPNGGQRKPEGNLVRSLLAEPRAWLLMAFLGLVNGGYKSVVVWLAPHYQQLGWGASASGSLLAVMAIFQAARRSSCRYWHVRPGRTVGRGCG